MKTFPEWFPDHPPIYDIEKSYAENAADGPFFTGEIPKRLPSSRPAELFGHLLHSPLGVPAGPLLNSRWIALAAKLGFDVVTYKTIRSFAHPGHELPNMIYIQPFQGDTARSIDHLPDKIDALTLTNSFGMPSKSPEFLLQDIERANRSLSEGQVMIVSVVGTPGQGVSFADDFVKAAAIAREGGAKIIEANFSCPNVGKSEGMLYMNEEAVFEFARGIVRAIHPIPLILKVGLFPSRESMQKVFLASARAGVQGICGINSVSMRVVNEDGEAALGEKRPTSGVCGGAIRKKALQFVRESASIIAKDKLGLTLLGCGGIMRAEQFDEFFDAGAKIAMSATGMMWDPYLANRYYWSKTHGPAAHHSRAL